VASAVLVALGWQRTQQDAARPRVLPLAPISAREIGRARRDRVVGWIGAAAWLDPARLGLATAIVVFAWTTGHDAVARLHAALFFALVASGTRARLGTLPGASVRRLAAAMSELRLDLGAPYVAVRLLGRGAEDATDARVYLSPSAEGASARVLEDLRMEIVDDDTHASRVASSLCLRVAAREDTPAELALRAWAESEGVSLHEIARRRAVLVPLPSRGVGATVERVLRGVLSLAPHEHDATVRDELLAAE
ncbi:MAG: hypothetical protein K1X94_13260, partial [Sandaracinaceae bacterium]|nr:hypothetical protein [Sandaracinaceae bacterium]